MKKMVRDTSIISYRELQAGKLGLLQQKVFDVIKQHPLGITDREIINIVGIEGNSIRPRRYELFKKGLVVEAGKRKCSISGKLALTWKLNKQDDEPIFNVDGNMAYQTRMFPFNEWLKLKEFMENQNYFYVGDGKWMKKLEETLEH